MYGEDIVQREIGHFSMKLPWPYGCAGSNPVLSTNYKLNNNNMDNYNIETVKTHNIPIMTIDNVSPKEFPRKMLVWHQDEQSAVIRWVLYIIPDKNCKNPIIAVASFNEESFENNNTYVIVPFKFAKDIPEITPLQKEFDELQIQIKSLQEKANDIQKKL